MALTYWYLSTIPFSKSSCSHVYINYTYTGRYEYIRGSITYIQAKDSIILQLCWMAYVVWIFIQNRVINQYDNRLENISILIHDIYSHEKTNKPVRDMKISFSNTLFDDCKLFEFHYWHAWFLSTPCTHSDRHD